VSTAICWMRRDLRLADNTALAAALARADQVIPTFVLDPVLLERYAGTKRVAFLLAGLRQLDADLRARGSRLIVRRGDPTEEIPALVAESGASVVLAEEDYEPYARQRDDAVTVRAPLERVGGPVVRPPGVVHKSDGEPYVVFTPFSRKWKSFPPPRASELVPAPEQIPTPEDIESLPVPDEPSLPATVPFPVGESEAQRRLRAFVNGDGAPIYSYGTARDRMDLDGTSQLSPYLRFGMLSARQAVIAAYEAIDRAPNEDARRGTESWLDELIWREFYMCILYHFPRVLKQSFRENLHPIAWANDGEDFEAWCAGRTGYPAVDAAMRQLVESGWMHNRARMIVASFLVKDLLVDWRWGERFFMQHLLDGDPAANNGGWQWTAGTGTDAAPYFRIFNPVTQSTKYDPEGGYIRRWVPELAAVPDAQVHAPWTMSPEQQRECGCVLGRDYPVPMLDHAEARDRALKAYRSARERYGQGSRSARSR
jgi:deoxyribodipyrimidine photo-lyase